MNRTSGEAGGPRPNVLRDASTPNVLRGSKPGTVTSAGDRPARRGWTNAGALLALILVILSVAPRLFDVATTQDACARVEGLLSSASPETVRAEPIEWMPTRVVAGYQITLDGPTTLEMVVASRRNPDESRIELLEDRFVDGYEQSWRSSSDHVEFGAQRFATVEGALAFHAFANRYACQFANEAFRGPRGSVGLQIRFASDPPIGEQVSWVSGTTRVIVFVDHPAPPPDHARVESLVELIPVR
ncbi:MAG TPA: hypothetical protein VFW02_06310 [Candidatus Limnocylindrales bacterium]|nr:hypothetical protein [Candidatus Limnocylindrales bacterium]